MRHLTLGTAGHIDHGKTTLVRALTGVDTDRLAEEKRRGITIDLGFARMPLAGGIELGVVDVPGHEAFVRNMLAGATGIDLVLLVVAADEGVMPQTREHLAIVELLGVRGGVVAITKTDLVDPDWLDLVGAELKERLANTPFAAAPLVPVSAETGAGLDELRSALCRVAAAVADRDVGNLFRLPVDRVFTVRGTGTVVTGTLWSGRIARDETVRLLPSGDTARVRGIQVHGRDVTEATAGQRVALALVGVGRDDITRGCTLVGDRAWEPSRMLTVRLRTLADTGWAIEQRQRIRFHLGTAEVMGRVMVLDGPGIAPGDTGWAQLRLEAPIVARAGDRFVVRSYSPVTTIAGGIVLEPVPPKRRRLEAADRARLETAVAGSAPDGVAALAELAAWAGSPIERLSIESPQSPATIAATVDRLDGERLIRAGGRIFAAAIAERAEALFLDTIDAAHAAQPLRPGMDREELRRALPTDAPAELREWTLARMLDRGVLAARGGLVARTGFRPHMNQEQQGIRDRILAILEGGGLTPPPLSEMPPALREHRDFPALVRLLEYEDRIAALTPDLYLVRSAINDAVETVRRVLGAGPGFTPAEFKTVLPVSRKYLIPLLEYFDRTGITARRGDSRVLAGH